ncbi:MAG: ADP-glyceromanno-heptose 6-epimerase [Elusimicrobiota bacterium]
MIVVTGGAGFIGSAVVWKLNQRGMKDILIVDEVDKLSKEKKKNLSNLQYKDLIDKDNYLNRIKNKGNFKDTSFIFHLGACSDTTETNEEYMMKTNYLYTKLLISKCVENDKNIIYASSAATYGDGKNGFSDAHDKLENFTPLNIYGKSKHLVDLWVKGKDLLNKVTGLKYFNVYGPNEYHKGEMRSFVVKAFEQIKKSGKVKLFKSYKKEYKDGEQLRDFIYVKDAVDMTLCFMDNLNNKGIYNIGTGKPRTWNDLAKAVFKAMGKYVNIEYIEMPGAVRGHYQYYTCADMEKFKNSECDFSPCSLEKGVEDYVRNYLIPRKNLE